MRHEKPKEVASVYLSSAHTGRKLAGHQLHQQYQCSLLCHKPHCHVAVVVDGQQQHPSLSEFEMKDVFQSIGMRDNER